MRLQNNILLLNLDYNIMLLKYWVTIYLHYNIIVVYVAGRLICGLKSLAIIKM